MNTRSTEMQQHILDTARPIILHKGFSAVGLNELLSAAKVPKGSFYHYFKSKESFGEALLERYFDGYLARLDTLLNVDGLSGAERLMAYWQSWLDTQSGDNIEARCLAVKLGSEVSDLSEPMRLCLQRGTDRIVARLAECIAKGCEDGSLSPVLDASSSAQVLYSQWLGATVLSKIRRDHTALAVALEITRKLLNFSSTPGD